MREKIAAIINKIFGWGIYLCLIAGGLTFFGFVIALIMGGDSGQALAVFLHKKYFPIVIRIASFVILGGLVGMYLNKQQALSMKTDKAEADEDIKEAKEMEG
ncbi:hypothetical protein LJC14_05175 [Treponema sp. OttesenSCG-928-L16]|nr:hypothetical protein [Treponema sp. OttesenSCG-928-L16]